ncbi:MAG: EpsG family protein [Acutalibacteraceae bacterium]|nr:EpsG family protein [Acutalibacteraceae bacterium]
MVVYWIMFVYTLTVSFLFEFLNKNMGVKSLRKKNNNAAQCTLGILGAVTSFLLIIIVPGIRGYVADTTAYIMAFESETRTLVDIPSLFMDLLNAKGPLWGALQIIVKNYISDNVTVFFMIIAVFQGFAVAKTFCTYTENFTFSSYLFITGYTFFWMLNGARQFTAVCIVLLASKYLCNKQFGKYVLFVVIAFFFHSSSIMCAVVYFIAQGEPFNKRVIWTIILALLCVLFIDSFTGILNSSLEDTQYSVSGQDYTVESGMSPLVTLMNAVPVILVLWQRKRVFSIERPRYIDVFINVACVNIGICLIANFTSGITFGRLPVYFIMYNYILIPWIIEKAFVGMDKIIIRFMCIMLYMVYFLYQGYLTGSGSYQSLYGDFLYNNFSIKLF